MFMEVSQTNNSNVIMIYGNLLIDDEKKFEALKFTLPGWLAYWKSKCLLRIRGRYSSEVVDFCMQFDQVQIIQDSNFIQWRKQVLWDIKTFNSKYIMLYLEDHMLSNSPPEADLLISEMSKYRVDIFQYSWYKQYDQLRRKLTETSKKTSTQGVYCHINKSNHSLVLSTKFPWIVSMTSVFNHNFFVKILESNRPFIRKFDPKAPYEIEQPPKSNWYFPLVYGLSNFEMGICLDDDNSVQDSSAISRGLYHGDRSEVAQFHDSQYSLTRILRMFTGSYTGNKLKSKLPESIRKIIKAPIQLVGYSIYTVQTQYFSVIDHFTKIKKMSE